MRVLFVGIHNKKDWKPLDSRSKSGKLIDRCIERLGSFECVKTNLFDLNHLPKENQLNEAEKWAVKYNFNALNDIVIGLGAIVCNTLDAIGVKHVKMKHPSIVWSRKNQDLYVAEIVFEALYRNNKNN